MPAVFPFGAVQYRGGKGDVSALVAPPYDVLDAAGKAALLKKDAKNIVGIDLPHTPAKELGPPAAYEGAGAAYRAFLKDGTLVRRANPAMFAYRETFKSADGKTYERSGMACCVETVPFGPRTLGGILPHEETFSGPKEDRLALMKATKAQMSPIFGLHADEQGLATSLLKDIMSSRAPDMTAHLGDGVQHEVWTVADGSMNVYQQALRTEDIFIADGHHRYNTALNYIKYLEAERPGGLPANHAARRCMMVLVGMSDPGLVIWPTHRVLGGMKGYTIEKFVETAGAGGAMKFEAVPGGLAELEKALHRVMTVGEIRVGVHDFKTGKGFVVTPGAKDPLAGRFAGKPREWRTLDVAYIQHAIVEEVCQPKLNDGQAVKWAFPHTLKEVAQIGSGAETGAGGGKVFGAGGAQLAVIVRPTPLETVRVVSRANELMPQKSTFFFPKLATGLFVNPLE